MLRSVSKSSNSWRCCLHNFGTSGKPLLVSPTVKSGLLVHTTADSMHLCMLWGYLASCVSRQVPDMTRPEHQAEEEGLHCVQDCVDERLTHPNNLQSMSQGQIFLDKCMCCHTVIEFADQTCYFTQSWCINTGPTGPFTDPITQGQLLENHYLHHWYDSTGENGMQSPFYFSLNRHLTT